jgi:adenylosuccinate lyase
MIHRYALPEMVRIFSEENKLRMWLDVELAVLEAQGKAGIVPEDAARDVKERLKDVDIEEVNREAKELEKETGHDILAFLMVLERKSGESGRYLHYGLTSSDVLDTGLALQLRDALDLIIESTKELTRIVLERAKEYKLQPIMGRTHGVFAEPTSLGLKFLGFHSELTRDLKRLESAREETSVGKISGSVGNHAYVDKELEGAILSSLGLGPEPVSTQIVPRDRHAALLSALSLTGAALERLALEIRLLHQTEISEVMEPFGEGQRGSSSMPHKKNPILAERICGLARLLRGYLIVAQENIALWHERDISHSSAERHILPDAATTLYYMLHIIKEIMRGIAIDTKAIHANLERFGDFYLSQPLLLALISKGVLRQEAYSWVQDCAFQAREEGRSLMDVASNHSEIKKTLSETDLKGIREFDFLRNVDDIFDRHMRSNDG